MSLAREGRILRKEYEIYAKNANSERHNIIYVYVLYNFLSKYIINDIRVFL